jgi:hypothetical protein
MHLWEADHAYYCNEGNYYSRESTGQSYKRLQDFLDDEADADLDMNLVFRWDWVEGEDYGAQPYAGDDNYRNGLFKVFFMGQRKGIYRHAIVEVCRADEPAVIAYLQPRLKHLMGLWAPLVEAAA